EQERQEEAQPPEPLPGQARVHQHCEEHRDEHERDRGEHGEPGGVAQRDPHLRIAERFSPVRQADELGVRAGERGAGEAHPQPVDRGPDEEQPEGEQERGEVEPAAQGVDTATPPPGGAEGGGLPRWGDEAVGGGHRASPSTDGQDGTWWWSRRWGAGPTAAGRGWVVGVLTAALTSGWAS